MSHHIYKPAGVCSAEISFEIQAGCVRNVRFTGGCSGNLQAIARLVDGLRTEDILQKLTGIDCDGRGTSCSDQLAAAVQQALAAAAPDAGVRVQ